MTYFQAFDAPIAPAAPPPDPGLAPAPVAGLPAAPSGPPPTISANRRRLDNRFPVLAFSVRTQGRPWFEVLLTTDRALFDPASAARRTPANFYAGRQDGGLARAAAQDTAYVVPAAVLRRFATALPRPAEIFFTVAAYDRPDGPPVLAQPVATLASTAPSVALSRDYQAQTMAVVLGVPAEKLLPVDHVAPRPGTVLPAPEDEELAGAQSWSSEDDDALALADASSAWFEDPHALALDDATAFDTLPPEPDPDAAAMDGAGAWDDWTSAQGSPADGAWPQGLAADAYAEQGYGAGTPATNGYAANGYAANGHAANGYAANGHAADAGLEEYDDDVAAQAYEDPDSTYDDGVAAYGLEDDEVPDGPGAAQGLDEPPDAEAYDYDDGYPSETAGEGWSEAAGSAWPVGAAEPGQLADADDERLEEELAAGAAADDLEPYDDAQGWADDPAPGDEPGAVASALEVPLDIPGKVALVTKLGRLFESSAGYAGINADTEFATPGLPQHGRWHVGLSYGLIQFTQDSGGLGQLLRMMRLRDPARFREVFGPDADALVELTTRPGPSGRELPGGRSARVQPLGGADLWVEPWLSRFRTAAAHPPFQAAQNELAVRRHVDPLLPFAAGFGLTTERALAMVVDRGIQMGTGGARRWLTGAIGPIRTDAQRQQALGALGFPDVAAFQRASGIRGDGDFGPLTHAAMVGALRRLGPASPVPIPTREQMLDAIVARADAAGTFWRRRPRVLRTSTEFADAPLTWPAAAAPR